MGKSRMFALFAVFAVLLASAAVAGCGGGSSSESEGGSEKLTVASDIPYPPFEQGRPGEYTGFDIELIEAIGEKVGREVEIQDTSFETIFRDVAQGKFDAVVSSATITPEREKEVSFSDPYYLTEQSILVKEGSEIKGLADLEGKVVAAEQGTTGLQLAKEKANAGELRPYPEGPDAVNALKAGTVEAVVLEGAAAVVVVEEEGGVEVAEDIPTGEEYGIAVARDSTELLTEINKGLEEVIADGTYSKLYETWFHHKPPQKFLE